MIAANEGVDDPTKSLWLECAQVGMPRAVAITSSTTPARTMRVTHGGTASVRRQGIASVSGRRLPLYRPDRAAVPDTLRYSTASALIPTTDGSYSEPIEVLRGTLIEGIIEESEDETLMERYLGGEEIDQAVLIEDLEKAVAAGRLPSDPGM